MVTTLILNAVVAHGYTSGTVGYDISYPQCNSATLPTGTFGIVGVTDGRPFTGYSCFGKLYAHAAVSGTPSLYFNTGYSGAYRKNITSACRSGPSQAYEIGCSEADYAASQASGLGVAMWWLDVETGNSWSTRNLGLNQATIQGATDFFFNRNLQVGVYSTAGSWKQITGGSFTPRHSAGDWVAGVNGSCATTNQFDAATILLSQFPNGGFDGDNAC